jgi:spermidine synthase
VDLPDPENAQLNRFYTQEFFEESKSILEEGGALSFSLIGSENYLEEKGLALNRSVHAALKKVFEHTLVFPGTTHYYLASDAPLVPNIGGVLGERQIVTKRLVDYELPTMADPFRMDMLKGLLTEKEAPANRDLSPLAFGHLIELWLKKSGSPRTFLYVTVFVILALAVVAGCRDLLRFTIASSGYAGMAFELALLLLFQVIYGYVYLRMCLFITLYLIGSALGAMASGTLKTSERWQVLACDAGLILCAGLACVAAQVGTHIKGHSSLFVMQYGVIPALMFVLAFVAGYQFSTVSRMARGIGAEITGRLYVSDLAGAACGTILTGLIFLPKIGVIGVLISVAALKAVSLALNAASVSRRV